LPELPEVERARAFVEEHGLGRRITGVEDGDTYVCRPHGPGEIAGALKGRSLTHACRRGKAMWFPTEGDGPELGLHLGMEGHLVVDEEPHPRGWDRFALSFEDGTRLALRDKRRLGRAVLDPDLSALGPDAALVGRDAFRRRVGRGSAPIKARLLDQSVLAGVGNLLADETLWRAGIDPRRPAADLDVEDLDALRRALRAATRDAVRLGGVHTGRLMPERRRDGRCPTCGTALARSTVGGRTTFWCPRHQPIGPS
jgi:formamidopyrimidine-DNA glycosylase